MEHKARGFTLIELLVVIGILGLLAVALLPQVVGGTGRAQHFACQRNLQSLYQNLLEYRSQRGHFPNYSGAQFLLATWTGGAVERSPTVRDHFFCPGLGEEDQALMLRQMPLEELWPDINSVTSLDTHYAGFNRQGPERPRLESDNTCIAADDNELGPNHRDGAVNALFGGGAVRHVVTGVLVEQGLLSREDPFIPVGPDSPVDHLRHVIQ